MSLFNYPEFIYYLKNRREGATYIESRVDCAIRLGIVLVIVKNKKRRKKGGKRGGG